MRKSFLILVLCLAAFSIPKGWKAIRGPSLRLLCPIEEKWRIGDEAEVDPKTFEALDQPFFPWGRGSQSEVFLSEDGKWVIKIPRNKKARPYLLGRFREGSRMSKGCAESYFIAGQELADETAVAYVHRGGPIALPRGFCLCDFLGRRLPMKPEFFAFALQERKPLLAKELAARINQESAKEILSSLLELIEAERAKGWVCSDYAFLLNFGYEGGRAFRIDIGSYIPLESAFSWETIAKPIDRFLEEAGDRRLQEWWHQEIAERQANL